MKLILTRATISRTGKVLKKLPKATSCNGACKITLASQERPFIRPRMNPIIDKRETCFMPSKMISRSLNHRSYSFSSECIPRSLGYVPSTFTPKQKNMQWGEKLRQNNTISRLSPKLLSNQVQSQKPTARLFSVVKSHSSPTCKICNSQKITSGNPIGICHNDGSFGIPSCDQIQSKTSSKTFKNSGTNAFHYLCLKSSANPRYRNEIEITQLKSKKKKFWCNTCLEMWNENFPPEEAKSSISHTEVMEKIWKIDQDRQPPPEEEKQVELSQENLSSQTVDEEPVLILKLKKPDLKKPKKKQKSPQELLKQKEEKRQKAIEMRKKLEEENARIFREYQERKQKEKEEAQGEKMGELPIQKETLSESQSLSEPPTKKIASKPLQSLPDLKSVPDLSVEGAPLTKKEKLLKKSPTSLLKEKKLKQQQKQRLGLNMQEKRIISLDELSEDQKTVLEFVEKGYNIFFTGSAGTGKSYLLNKIKDTLFNQGKLVAVTASTGIAAVNIGGVTLHSWGGIGITENYEDMLKLAKRKAKNWKKSDVLIIDEISMLSGQTFELVEQVARELRGIPAPFGGMQLIVTGDFFQLPPVSKDGSKLMFAFESFAWKRSIDVCIEMSSIFRQKDPVFIDVLNKIRVGTVDSAVREVLEAARLNNVAKREDKIIPTLLYSKNSNVDRLNEKKLSELPGEAYSFSSIDKSSIEIPYQNLISYLSGFLAPKVLSLKLNAQVMLLKNISPTLINGSRGVVVDFVESEQTVGPEKNLTKWPFRPVVKFTNGETRAILPERFSVESSGISISRTQLPLKLAYAMTIHKSQGLSIDRAQISLARVWEPGQSYVALSRMRSLEGLQILDWDVNGIRADPRVTKFYSEGSENWINEFSKK